MTIVLASKPGITGATVLNIPKDWDPTWFRNFINSMLKGADIRNADGTNGIAVSGNISSPYATISIGKGPIVIPAGATGPTLTVNGPTGGTAAVFTTPSDKQVQINAAGTGQFSTLQFTQNGTVTGQLFSDNTNGFMELSVNNGGANGFKINQGTGPVVGRGPVAAGFVDMTPDRGTFTLTGTGFTTAVTTTATWYRIGNIVALNVGNGMQGTSNATTFTMTGLPAAITPNVSQTNGCADLENNSAAVFGSASFTAASSTITMSNGPNSGAPWTAAGTKGFFNSGGSTIFYLLN